MAVGMVVGLREGDSGVCVAHGVYWFSGGFEFLFGPFCVPPKLTFTIQLKQGNKHNQDLTKPTCCVRCYQC